jgi:hypothetical protein
MRVTAMTLPPSSARPDRQPRGGGDRGRDVGVAAILRTAGR